MLGTTFLTITINEGVTAVRTTAVRVDVERLAVAGRTTINSPADLSIALTRGFTLDVNMVGPASSRMMAIDLDGGASWRWVVA